MSPAQVLNPLYQAATKKTPGTKFEEIWKKQNLQKDFDRAKQMLMLACELTLPDPNLPLALVADASASSIGASLEQLENGKWTPLGFWSKSLNPAQCAWSTFRRELLAIKEGIRHFIDEIDGRALIIFTDHKPLLGAFGSQNSMKHDPIAMNHIMEISNWSQDVRHIKGMLNPVADALSRRNVKLGDNYSAEFKMPHNVLLESAAVNEVLSFETINHAKLAQDQLECPDVKSHKSGKHVENLNMADVEFAPGLFISVLY